LEKFAQRRRIFHRQERQGRWKLRFFDLKTYLPWRLGGEKIDWSRISSRIFPNGVTLGLTVTVLAIFLTQHFSAPQPSVEPKIERPDRARKPRVFANQGLPATTLPVARATAPMTQPNPAPIQLTREEISTAIVVFKIHSSSPLLRELGSFL
jgi:hypothetical protein